MDGQQNQSLINIVTKLKIFQGLGITEVTRLLKHCTSTSYQQGEIIFEAGGRSQELFILLQGSLKVVGRSGTGLGDIPAGTCCGEMGIFTGQPRSATVVATEKSVGFIITKTDLTSALRADPAAHLKILQNLVTLLSERLASADVNIETYATKLKKAEDEQSGIY